MGNRFCSHTPYALDLTNALNLSNFHRSSPHYPSSSPCLTTWDLKKVYIGIQWRYWDLHQIWRRSQSPYSSSPSTTLRLPTSSLRQELTINTTSSNQSITSGILISIGWIDTQLHAIISVGGLTLISSLTNLWFPLFTRKINDFSMWAK